MADTLIITARWEGSGRGIASVQVKSDGTVDAWGGDHHRILSTVQPPPMPIDEGLYRCLERIMAHLREVDER